MDLTNINDLENQKTENEKTCLASKTTIQPHLLVIGPKISASHDFYVCIDNVKYKCSSFLVALDICFQLFFTFDHKYPTECELIWLFIQKYIFSLTTKYDIKSSAVSALLSSLQ